MNVQVFAIPYDSGHENLRLGAGPQQLLEHGLVDVLAGAGHEVTVHWIRAAERFATEAGTSFALCRLLADGVRAACENGSLPLVISGNCFSSLGAVSGLCPSRLGLVWFDAHGEFNTPDTTVSGYLDGMGLATATGNCWKTMAAGIPGFHPVQEERIVLVGARDLDQEEGARLRQSEVAIVRPADLALQGVYPVLGPVFDRLAGGAKVSRVYLHLDLDVLDPAEACANELAVSGGLTIAQVEDALNLLRSRFEIAGVGLAGYDPSFDCEGRTARAALRLLVAALGINCASTSRTPGVPY